MSYDTLFLILLSFILFSILFYSLCSLAISDKSVHHLLSEVVDIIPDGLCQ